MKGMKVLMLTALLCFGAVQSRSSSSGDSKKVCLKVTKPEGEKKYPAILAIGGSEGGYAFSKDMADSFVRHGFLFASLAYFSTDSTDLPGTLVLIPLEYFQSALDSLLRRPDVDTSRIGLLSISKGTEAALHLASTRREIKALAAHVPSNVYWYGLTSWKGSGNSSWSWKNKEVPFVPYGRPRAGWTSDIVEYYKAGLKSNPDRIAAATIPVEKMHCHLLLTSGTADRLWPSTQMAGQIIVRLDSAGYVYEKAHIAYKDAGHGVYRTPLAEGEYPEYLEGMGGTREGNMEAINHNWSNTLAFFQKHLQATSE